MLLQTESLVKLNRAHSNQSYVASGSGKDSLREKENHFILDCVDINSKLKYYDSKNDKYLQPYITNLF
jgi:hypothetical protein